MFKPRPMGTRENPLKDGTSNALCTAGIGLRCNERHLDSDAMLSTQKNTDQQRQQRAKGCVGSTANSKRVSWMNQRGREGIRLGSVASDLNNMKITGEMPCGSKETTVLQCETVRTSRTTNNADEANDANELNTGELS
mmetsp:Transcript_14177/g.19929  ORF Transcript_14177/g.19929 Transcript_14177/m.19929 type:complete len:138 (+) Transcript_14177:5078-5491(+)